MESWPTWLKIYFITLGALTLVQTVLPFLIVAAAYLFPPALVLYLAPSLLLYSTLLLPIRRARNEPRVRRNVVIAACIGAVLFVSLGIPYILRSRADALLAEAAELDQPTAVNFPMPANPRSVAFYSTADRYSCTSLCQRLLFGGEIDLFTAYELKKKGHGRFAATRAGEARSYWLQTRPVCPPLQIYTEPPAALQARVDAGECLIGEEGPDPAPDVEVIVETVRVPGKRLFFDFRNSVAKLKIQVPGAQGKQLFTKTYPYSAIYPIYPLVFFNIPGRRHGWIWSLYTTKRTMGNDQLFQILRQQLNFRIADVAAP